MATVLFLGGCLIALQNADQMQESDIFQKNACGPICVSVIAQHYNRPDLFEEIFRILPPTGQPRNLKDLMRVSNEIGFYAFALKWNYGEEPSHLGPAIIRLNEPGGANVGHFVVVQKVANGKALVLDLPRQAEWIPIEQLWMMWDGAAIYISDSPQPAAFGSNLASLVLCVVGILLGALALFFLRAMRVATSRIKDEEPSRADRVTAPVSSWFIVSAMAPAAMLVVLVGYFFSATTNKTRPVLEYYPRFAEIRLDHNSLPQNIHKSVIFKIKNNSDQKAVISDVVASCGCATPRLSADAIPPGGEIELKVEVQPPVEAQKPFSIFVEFSHPSGVALELPGLIIKSRTGN